MQGEHCHSGSQLQWPYHPRYMRIIISAGMTLPYCSSLYDMPALTCQHHRVGTINHAFILAVRMLGNSISCCAVAATTSSCLPMGDEQQPLSPPPPPPPPRFLSSVGSCCPKQWSSWQFCCRPLQQPAVPLPSMATQLWQGIQNHGPGDVR